MLDSVGGDTKIGDATHSCSSSMRLLGVRVDSALAGAPKSPKLSSGLAMSCSLLVASWRVSANLKELAVDQEET